MLVTVSVNGEVEESFGGAAATREHLYQTATAEYTAKVSKWLYSSETSLDMWNGAELEVWEKHN